MTLAEMLRQRGGYSVAEAADLDSARAYLTASGGVALVLLDFSMPGMTVPDGLRQIIALNGGRPTALLTGTGNADVARRARAAGAQGFLTKSLSPDRLLHGVARLLAGDIVFESDVAPVTGDGDAAEPLQGALHLTPRELDVLRGLCDGKANKEIARDLEVQEVTVKLHVKTLSRKLQARNRTHAAMLAKEMRLI